MALVLPNSIFFHVGRTAGHCVRKTIREMGIPTYDVGAFHDWPSNIPLTDDEQKKMFFCFVRHPLTWLKSFWGHHMQFGWGTDTYSRAVQSDSFAEFLEKAVAAYPHGPATEIFRPFVSQCREVGRQESLEADLLRILERAGERIVPSMLAKREVTTVSVDRRIADCATAPREVLEKVLQSEREICERFGYEDVPRSLIGPAQVCLAMYLPLGKAKHTFTADHEVTQGVSNSFVIDGQRVASVSRSPTLPMAIHRTLDRIDLDGKDFIDVCCEDGAFCFFAETKQAANVTGVTREVRSVTANLKAALESKVCFLKHGYYGVDQAVGRKFDVVLSWGHFHLARYPLLLIRTLSRLMKEGGTLVLATQYLDAFPGVPVMYAPVGSESPIRALGCSFFNKEGLFNALTSFGFHDFKVCETLEMGISTARDFARMPFDTRRVYHDSESALATLVMSCRWSPAIADQDPRYVMDCTTGQSLVASWDGDLPSNGLPECMTNNEMLVMLNSQLHRHTQEARRLHADLQASQATVTDRETVIEGTRRELVARTEEVDQARRDLVDRTEELDQARRDLMDRTRELDETRHELIDRTARLEQAEEALRRLREEATESPRNDDARSMSGSID